MRRLFRRKVHSSQNHEKGADSIKADGKAVVTQKSFPTGIKTLYSSEAALVDIVFIHGLTGDRERTWSAKEQNPWPGELLPKKLPNIRVLTYGYDAYVVDLAGVVSKNRVSNHAMNLVTTLANHRDEDGTQERPLIFVCHSLGGLVCQDALGQAQQRPEPYLKQIYMSTCGVIFMGTPHRGSGLAKWGEALARSLGLVKQTNPAILEVLTRESEVLERIQESFGALLRARAQEKVFPLEIKCFFEELPLAGVGMVVPRESAAISGYAATSIHQNHMDMTKFASETDPAFIAVVGELRRWIRQVENAAAPPEMVPASPKSLTISEKEFLGSIGPRCYSYAEERVPGTCTWTISNEQYHSWLQENHSSVLWVAGAAGTGKTTLANFLVQELEQRYSIQERSSPDYALCSFFCSREVEGRHDISSMLQDLILQLTQPRRKLIKTIKAMYGIGKQEQSLSSEKIWRIFETVLSILPCQCLFIVIDALDECNVDWRKALLERLARIVTTVTNDSPASRKHVKIILSGQPQIRASWNFKSQSIEHYQIDIEDRLTGVSHDLQLFVDFRVAELVAGGFCAPDAGKRLQLILKSKAESSFLWLDIMFKHIEQGFGHRLQDIEKILSSMPPNLQQAYTKYLPIVPPGSQQILQDYLQILIASSRPLTLAEINILTAAANQNLESVSVAGITNEKATRMSMQRALGPIIKFPQGNAQFVHSTARQSLMLISQQPEHPLHQSHSVDPFKAHLFCAKACMSYLLDSRIPSDLFIVDIERPESASTNGMSPVSDHLRGNDNDDDSDLLANIFDIGDVQFLKDPDSLEREACPKVNRRWQAFDYAARNWTYHLQRAKTTLDDDSVSMGLRLVSSQVGRSSNWYKYQRHQSSLKMPSLDEVNAVIIAAMFDLPQLLQIVLNRLPEQPSTECLSSALFWAASRNCESAVKLLLQSSISSKETLASQAPLAAAAKGGSESICKLLLAAEEIDPNQTNSQGKSALIVAAEANHDQIVRQILHHKAIKVDQVDPDGRTAFILAARSGSLECVRALHTDGRADVNKADDRGQTALLHASHAGHLSVACELLAMTGIMKNVNDNSGRNAISLASQQGHSEVVRVLFKAEVDPTSKDKDGRNSISWAANSQKAVAADHRNESVMEYLVRNVPKACDEPDDCGWTPLAWALDTPGYLRAAELLLSSSSVDVDQRDKSRRSPLHWAASAGMVDIVKCILQRPDVNVNAKSKGGRTPLGYAASSGMMEVLKLLLQRPEIDLFHLDDGGRSVTYWARLNNHLDIVDVLEQRVAL